MVGTCQVFAERILQGVCLRFPRLCVASGAKHVQKHVAVVVVVVCVVFVVWVVVVVVNMCILGVFYGVYGMYSMCGRT